MGKKTSDQSGLDRRGFLTGVAVAGGAGLSAPAQAQTAPMQIAQAQPPAAPAARPKAPTPTAIDAKLISGHGFAPFSVSIGGLIDGRDKFGASPTSDHDAATCFRAHWPPAGKWYLAQALAFTDDQVLVHFIGWSDKWREWLPVVSTDRVAPAHTRSLKLYAAKCAG